MKKILFLLLCLVKTYAASPLNGITDFGWDLFLLSSKEGTNTVISPYSIYTALAMTAAGAREETLDQMRKIMTLPSNMPNFISAVAAQEKALKDHLSVANALWVAPKFFIEPAFKKTIENNYHAAVQTIDFNKKEAVGTINQWVSDRTHKKIDQLLSSSDLSGSTRLVLTNALYFSAQFLKPFNTNLTAVKPFWAEEATQLQVSTMEQTASLFYAENETFQTVALPFKDTLVALVIFLPKEKTFKPLAPLLNPEKFRTTIENLAFKKVHVQLPKFTLQQRCDLNTALSQAGLTLPFSQQADFSGIDGKKDLFLDKVIHEAFFALDENGVIAAAATAASMNMKSSAPAEVLEFNADHPFIFSLVDLQTKVPLFLGELKNP